MAKINVSSLDSMSDQPVDISIVGLKPHQLITLHSYTTTDHEKSFECVAQYITDQHGCISLSKDSSVGGSFKGKEPMGIFWAMKPSLGNKRPYARFAKLDVTTPLVVTIKAYDASIKSLEEIHDMRKKGNLDQLELASVIVNRLFMAPGTKRITLTVEKDGIHGTLFIPPGDGPFPGVITMFGGYPGTMEFKAALLASHGFAALALAYYGVPGLPEDFTVNGLILELEYFEKAVNLMSNHEQIDGKSGIGIMGISFSSFTVLAMAECIPNIRCVIWLNGHIYPFYCNMSFNGKKYASEPYNLTDIEMFNKPVEFIGRSYYPKYNGTTIVPQKNAIIKFYKCHRIGFMFIAGLSDCTVTVEYNINKAEQWLKNAKHPNYQILRYPGAGHLIEPPFSIHNQTTVQKGQNAIFVWGGEMIPHCKAQEDSWSKQIKFLKSNLTQTAWSKL